MKYIRTKDGIYELEKYKEKYHYFKVNGSVYKIQKINECKQADTIKELCDECVIISKYAKKPKIMSFYEAEYFINNYVNKIKSADPIIAIYGAIWVQLPNGAWRLEPVAKTNDKGEMELL